MIITYAFCLDLLIGDPRYFFHPVRIFGKIARISEKYLNRNFDIKLYGILCSCSLYIGVFFLFFKIDIFLDSFKYGFVFKIILFYMSFALHDLLKHGYQVYYYLKKNNLIESRKKLSYMVGRKTAHLDQKEIFRGVIESLSENLVDGVTSPLFFAILFGLPGVYLYKMINTLDSLWGHKNNRYKNFGFCAAKIDDLVNYIPARLTAPLIILIGACFSNRLLRGFYILKRDGRKHSSPNSGLSESAIAGVLGIRLGGENHYNGYISNRPFVGEEINEISLKEVRQVFFICFITSCIFLFLISNTFSLIT